MKTLISSSLLVLFAFPVTSQPSLPDGAWHLREGKTNTVLLFQDGYFTSSVYTDDVFVNTWGGPFNIKNNTLSVKLEFDANESEQTGTTREFPISLKGDILTLNKNGSAKVFKRTDNGKAPLAGVWKITGREQEGKLTDIHQTGPRKTLKMLTGKRFQWFAINPETKEFSGTGGGTYTFENGKYTENILFFSRDNSRVGASLAFDGKIVDGKWHHSGLSSKGDKIYEVWGKVNPQ